MTINTDRLTTALDRRTPSSRAQLDGPFSQAAARRILANDRRREVLRCLLVEDGPLEMRTLVARIADDEHDATSVTPLLELRQRVHVSLCRTHLPLLEDHHILSYDRIRGLVSPGATLSVFESMLEFDGLERPITARLE
ncbi:DUF7344 domain-containing protein [Natronorubrum halophilum]|uniref:DUF7344 domain-containing protein n=1 Tax=Natronorubrum halophilum TaxID=1702106 RepID=UPI0010C195AA|nr:hypothetical protein [Natronorubrum halophilum]